MIQALYAAALGPGDPTRAAWTREWNARLDAATSDFDHPCATKPFIAWADAFLAACEREAAAPGPADCAARNQWVSERVEQCRAWTAWQLRDFDGHERTGGEPPSIRVE